MPVVRLSIDPWTEVEVTRPVAKDLRRQGLLYDGPVPPAPRPEPAPPVVEPVVEPAPTPEPAAPAAPARKTPKPAPAPEGEKE